MKGKEKSSTQQIYKVRMYRDFSFPSFSVNKNNTLEDLTYKAMEEVKENYRNERFFNFEIINVLPFTLKTEIEEISGNMDYDFFIKEIALEDTREKYGEIDYEKNPDIFELGTKSDTSVTYNLKPKIEDYFLERLRKHILTFGNLRIRR